MMLFLDKVKEALGGDFLNLFDAIKDGNKKDICFYSGKVAGELASSLIPGGAGLVNKIRKTLGSLNKALGPMAGKCKLIGKSCFVSGTLVLSGNAEMIPIEDIEIGDRVLTSQVGEQSSETSVDPKTWRLFKLQMPDLQNPDDIFQISILRPQDWLKAEKLDGYVWMELEELHLEGFAKILEIADCPPIAEGPGRVVTMTVNHDNNFVYHLTFGPRGPPLKVTGYHPLYSETRGDWVQVKYLEEGELLRTFYGKQAIYKKERIPGRFRVFNLEVEADHRYYAGDHRVLGHNSNRNNCLTDGYYDGEVARTTDGEIIELGEGTNLENRGTDEIYHAQDENYVGRSDDLETRDANSTDGIDRSPENISSEDIYLEGDTIEAQIKEQRVIDEKDSVVNGANKRDEISRATRGLPKDPRRK